MTVTYTNNKNSSIGKIRTNLPDDTDIILLESITAGDTSIKVKDIRDIGRSGLLAGDKVTISDSTNSEICQIDSNGISQNNDGNGWTIKFKTAIQNAYIYTESYIWTKPALSDQQIQNCIDMCPMKSAKGILLWSLAQALSIIASGGKTLIYYVSKDGSGGNIDTTKNILLSRADTLREQADKAEVLKSDTTVDSDGDSVMFSSFGDSSTSDDRMTYTGVDLIGGEAS